MKEISLSDKKYFELSIGKRILKEQIFQSKHKIPIYSANVNKIFGFVDKSNINDFSHDCVLWGIDGNFELNIIKKGVKFATTDHCGMIKILNDKIIPEYILYALSLKRQSQSLGFDRSLRASINRMEEVSIEIPTLENGEFDLDKQKSIAQKSKKLEDIKNKLKEIKEYFNETNIIISDYEIGKNQISNLGNRKLFKIDNGERVRKKDIDRAKGNIPVYSSSKFENEALGFVSDNIKNIVKDAKFFDGINLTINADGSVGSVFVRKVKFYANDICNIVNVVHPKIDINFLKYELRTQIFTMGLNWTNKLYKKKLSEVKVRIPVDEKGEYDLKRQKKIAEKYENIESIKKQLAENLDSMIIPIQL